MEGVELFRVGLARVLIRTEIDWMYHRLLSWRSERYRFVFQAQSYFPFSFFFFFFSFCFLFSIYFSGFCSKILFSTDLFLASDTLFFFSFRNYVFFFFILLFFTCISVLSLFLSFFLSFFQ